MPKARSVKESLNSDERIVTLSLLANLLFRALIGEADDHGRVQAHPAVLHGRLFAASRRAPTVADVAEALAELEDDGILRCYQKRGRSYAVILGWESVTCPWYQHLTQRAHPLHPGPDDPEEPHQMDLPLRAEGARRGKRERAAERREAGDEGQPQAAGGGAPAGDAGAAMPDDGRGHRVGGAGPDGGGAGPDARSAGAGQRGARAAGAEDGRGGQLQRGPGDLAHGVDRAGERAGQDEAGPEEPAQGSEAGTATRTDGCHETARSGPAKAPASPPGAPRRAGEQGGEQGAGDPDSPERHEAPRYRAGSTPAAPTSPLAAAGATSSATPTAAAGGLPAPQALALFAEAAGDRWAPGKKFATATGLAPQAEHAWLLVWGEARAAGYGEVELRQLGAALREGRLWRGPTLSPGELVRHLLDLLGQAAAPKRAPGTRNQPTWKEPAT